MAQSTLVEEKNLQQTQKNECDNGEDKRKQISEDFGERKQKVVSCECPESKAAAKNSQKYSWKALTRADSASTTVLIRKRMTFQIILWAMSRA